MPVKELQTESAADTKRRRTKPANPSRRRSVPTPPVLVTTIPLVATTAEGR